VFKGLSNNKVGFNALNKMLIKLWWWDLYPENWHCIYTMKLLF